MADDKTKKGLADTSRINLNEDYEVANRTKASGVSEMELQKAVKQAGMAAKALGKSFGKK